MSSAEVSEEIRQQLAIALDVDDLVAASRLARQMRPFFGVAKVGLELFSAAGPEVFGLLQDLGYEIFADLKLHDIPNTVGKASRVLGALGVKYLTMHAHGDVAMLRAGVEGFALGADGAELEAPIALAVTVLTSDRDAPSHIIPKRVRAAMEAGCGGLVCSGQDLIDVRTMAPRMVRVVPGIRLAGTPTDDQARVVTPRQAVDEGADVLVIGRAVTNAEDPVAAAAAIVDEISA